MLAVEDWGSTGQVLSWRPRKVEKGALLDKLSRAQADSSGHHMDIIWTDSRK